MSNLSYSAKPTLTKHIPYCTPNYTSDSSSPGAESFPREAGSPEMCPRDTDSADSCPRDTCNADSCPRESSSSEMCLQDALQDTLCAESCPQDTHNCNEERQLIGSSEKCPRGLHVAGNATNCPQDTSSSRMPRQDTVNAEKCSSNSSNAETCPEETNPATTGPEQQWNNLDKSCASVDRAAPNLDTTPCSCASCNSQDAECGLSMRGREKQEWSVTLYDVDSQGCVSEEDLARLVTMLYKAAGRSINGSRAQETAAAAASCKKIKLRLSVAPDPVQINQSVCEDQPSVSPGDQPTPGQRLGRAEPRDESGHVTRARDERRALRERSGRLRKALREMAEEEEDKEKREATADSPATHKASSTPVQRQPRNPPHRKSKKRAVCAASSPLTMVTTAGDVARDDTGVARDGRDVSRDHRGVARDHRDVSKDDKGISKGDENISTEDWNQYYTHPDTGLERSPSPSTQPLLPASSPSSHLATSPSRRSTDAAPTGRNWPTVVNGNRASSISKDPIRSELFQDNTLAHRHHSEQNPDLQVRAGPVESYGVFGEMDTNCGGPMTALNTHVQEFHTHSAGPTQHHYHHHHKHSSPSRGPHKHSSPSRGHHKHSSPTRAHNNHKHSSPTRGRAWTVLNPALIYHLRHKHHQHKRSHLVAHSPTALVGMQQQFPESHAQGDPVPSTTRPGSAPQNRDSRRALKVSEVARTSRKMTRKDRDKSRGACVESRDSPRGACVESRDSPRGASNKARTHRLTVAELLAHARDLGIDNPAASFDESSVLDGDDLDDLYALRHDASATVPEGRRAKEGRRAEEGRLSPPPHFGLVATAPRDNKRKGEERTAPPGLAVYRVGAPDAHSSSSVDAGEIHLGRKPPARTRRENRHVTHMTPVTKGQVKQDKSSSHPKQEPSHTQCVDRRQSNALVDRLFEDCEGVGEEEGEFILPTQLECEYAGTVSMHYLRRHKDREQNYLRAMRQVAAWIKQQPVTSSTPAVTSQKKRPKQQQADPARKSGVQSKEQSAENGVVPESTAVHAQSAHVPAQSAHVPAQSAHALAESAHVLRHEHRHIHEHHHHYHFYHYYET